MKAVFIAFDQAHYDMVVDVLQRNNSRGFTAWEMVKGRGTKTGEPHYGTHAWPSMASSILAMVEDDNVDNLMKALKQLDIDAPLLGLRAWTWNIEQYI